MSKNVLGTGYLSLQVLSDGITTSADAQKIHRLEQVGWMPIILRRFINFGMEWFGKSGQSTSQKRTQKLARK